MTRTVHKKTFKEEDEPLNWDLQWKNTPNAKIRESLDALDKELFLDHPVIVWGTFTWSS